MRRIGRSAEVSLKSDFETLLPRRKVGWPITLAITPPGELAPTTAQFSALFDDVANRPRKTVIFHSVQHNMRDPKLPQ